MNRIAITIVAIATVAVVGVARNASAQTPGMKVFTDQKCALCHSVAGKGNVKGPLDGVGTKLKADEIRKWIVSPAEMTAATKSTRKPAMKAFASLPKADLDALVDYMVSLKAK